MHITFEHLATERRNEGFIYKFNAKDGADYILDENTLENRVFAMEVSDSCADKDVILQTWLLETQTLLETTIPSPTAVDLEPILSIVNTEPQP